MNHPIHILQSRIDAVCPTRGLAILSLSPFSCRIDFDPAATQAQRSAAQAVIASFDVAQAQAELAAAETAERERQEFLSLIVSKWQNEFIPLRNWARTKGYPG